MLGRSDVAPNSGQRGSACRRRHRSHRRPVGDHGRARRRAPGLSAGSLRSRRASRSAISRRLQVTTRGRAGEELADSLVESAARTTSAFGAAGGVAAVRLALRRNPLMLAVQLMAEPVAVAATEIKLMAELHEVYDVQVTGTGADRARYFAKAWATARGINPLDPDSARSSLGGPMKGNLGRMLAARLGSRFSRAGPFMAGAAAGGLVNGRSTRELADALRAELRNRGGTVVRPL